MSVTFQADQPPIGWEINTWCAERQLTDVTGRVAAIDTAAQHTLDCTECAEQGGAYTWPIHTIDPVQMANGNASEVLAILGYPADELAGSAQAQDLAGRALVARAMLDTSPARQSETVSTPGRATIISMGREAGYLNRRVDEILTLAEEAGKAGVDVHWS